MSTERERLLLRVRDLFPSHPNRSQTTRGFLSVLVNKQIPDLTQGQQGSLCITTILGCLAGNLLQKFLRLLLVNPYTALLCVYTESYE